MLYYGRSKMVGKTSVRRHGVPSARMSMGKMDIPLVLIRVFLSMELRGNVAGVLPSGISG